MNSDALLIVACSFLAVILSWALPRRASWPTVVGWTAFCLLVLSPLTLIWLLASTLTVSLSMWLGERVSFRNSIVLIVSLSHLILLFAIRSKPWGFIGASYFTLRSIHLLLEWWTGGLQRPSLWRLLRYQFFLPVLIMGPIHRIQNFERELERRRWDWETFYAGTERAVFGWAIALLAGYVGRKLTASFSLASAGSFLSDWRQSGIDWLVLYGTFSGYSSLAIGTALMMGLRIEENFNRPYLATNLLEFWTRWHMTLSFWCRDYVFRPVAAATRSPILGLALAMIVIGLWHETSVYYLLWSAWHVIGIVLSRMWSLPNRNNTNHAPSRLISFLGPLSVLSWLTLARPVITRLLEAFTS